MLLQGSKMCESPQDAMVEEVTAVPPMRAAMGGAGMRRLGSWKISCSVADDCPFHHWRGKHVDTYPTPRLPST